MTAEDITLRGGTAADTLTGGDGDDKIYGGAGGDTLDGWGGNDAVHGDAGNDTLYGGDGNDTLYGGEGVDTLWGGRGNDTLDGGRDNDTLWGGLGADTFAFAVGDGHDKIVDFEDGDTIRITGVSGGFDGLVIEQDGADAIIRYGEGDTIRLSGVSADSLGRGRFEFPVAEGDDPKGGGVDDGTPNGNGDGDSDGDGERPVLEQVTRTEGAEGDRSGTAPQKAAGVKRKGGKNDDTLDGGDGDNTLKGRKGDDTLNGGGGDDVLGGGKGDDTLNGGDGADTLTGGRGSDTLTGGQGADTFIFKAGDGQDTIADFGDADTIRIDGVTGGFAGLTIDRDGSDAIVRYGDSGDTIRLKGVSADTLGEDRFILPEAGGDGTVLVYGAGTKDPAQFEPQLQKQEKEPGRELTMPAGGEDDDRLVGTSGDDILAGGEGNDALIGGYGDDTLYGDEGDDVLNGGRGADKLSGGSGKDTFVFTVLDGHDTITDYTAEDTLLFKGVPGGSVRMKIESDGDDAVIRFGYGDTIRLVGVKADTLKSTDFQFEGTGVIKLARPDHYYLGGTGLADILEVGAGDKFWKEMYGHGGNDIIRGNDKYNYILGGDGHDWIEGKGGGDELEGGKGDDHIYGGRGNDELVGESGNDWLYGEDGDDAIEGGHGNDIMEGGDGWDSLWGDNGDDVLKGGTGDDRLEGEGGHDTIDGGDGWDEISGGSGDDTLTGGAGKDAFLFGAYGEGHDTITDFQTGDRIVLTMLSRCSPTAPKTFDSLEIRQDGANSVIGYGDNGATITLLNVSADSLSASDFEFLNSSYEWWGGC